ncbi:MAG: SIR2 family protein, partial [Planctomycetota bacterium]
QRMSDKEALHPVPRTVRFRMHRWPTLFVGYSLRDYNFRLIFRTLRWNVDPANFPRSFSVDSSPDPLILKVWQNEMKLVTFVTQDLWTFIPWLFKEVNGKEYKHE